MLVGLPAVHNPAIEMDGTRGAAGKDKEVSAEDGKRAYNSVTGGLGSFIAEQVQLLDLAMHLKQYGFCLQIMHFDEQADI